MSGHVYKRCGCPLLRDEGGRRLNCPRPHGSWTMVADVPQDGDAPRRQHSKGGFATKRDAEAALRVYLSAADTGQVVLPTRVTVGDYLTRWLDAVEPSLAATAASNYRIIVRCYVLPHLATHKMTTLRPDHLISTYRVLLGGGGRRGRPLSATTVRTVHRILSKALGDAVRDGVLVRNPAANVPCPRRSSPNCRSGTAPRSRRSCRTPPGTGSTPPGYWRCCGACAAVSSPACAGPTSTSSAGQCGSPRSARPTPSGT